MALCLQLSQVFLTRSDFFPQLHGLVAPTLVFKLCLFELHEDLLSLLRVTIS